MNQDIQQLNNQFSIQHDNHNVIIKAGKGDMPVIEIKNSQASAVIALQGAHLLSWIPNGEEDVLWVSDDAKFAAGKSVRGGIPICWPWFSDHPGRIGYPAHGFARTSLWQIDSTETQPDGSTRITFSLHTQPDNEHMWIAGTTLTFEVTIGKTLQLQLVTHNHGKNTVTIGQALHSYFRVSKVERVLLQGLDNTWYLDKLDGFKKKKQQGPVIINQEVDRIYLDTTGDCSIEDPILARKIIIRKQGSRSTVVWNPWKETATRMGDLGMDGYKQMLCVESSNASEDVVDIAPGEVHRLGIEYELQHQS